VAGGGQKVRGRCALRWRRSSAAVSYAVARVQVARVAVTARGSSVKKVRMRCAGA